MNEDKKNDITKKLENQFFFKRDDDDISRYLICPFSNEMFLIHTKVNDKDAFCPKCNIPHGFQKKNKAMGGMESGIRDNAWVESW